MRKRVIAATLSIVLGASLVGAVADGAAASPPVRATQTQTGSQVSEQYDDDEITALLVAGQGRAAQEHPDIAKFLLPQSLADIPESKFAQLTRALLDIDPQYHAGVTVPVQSGDPYAVEGAIAQLNTDLEAVVQRNVALNGARVVADTGVGTNSFFYATDVLVYAQAVETIAEVVAVAVAVGAVGALLLVLAATTPDATDFERQHTYAAIAAAL